MMTQSSISFYQGNVVKLTNLSESKWEVVSVYYLDTNNDENILTNFMHKSDTRVVIVPVTAIEKFNSVSTKYVISTFDHAQHTERWIAI